MVLGECTFKNQKGVFFISNRTKKGKNFYQSYTDFMKLNEVRRIGVAKCGSNGRPTEKEELIRLTEAFFDNREESDGEHVFGVDTLVLLLPYYYPNEFPKENRDTYFVTMHFHELGEAKGGDVAADGTRDDEVQDQKERNYIVHLMDDHMIEAKSEVLPLYDDFLEQKGTIGKNSFLIDKFEAILFNLYLESQGRAGSIAWRMENFFDHDLTDQRILNDKECAEITKSDLPADNWLCRLLITKPEVESYPAFEVFRETVQSAAFAVRGKEMSWLDNFRYKREVYTP